MQRAVLNSTTLINDRLVTYDESIFNENGLDRDFRIASENKFNMFFLDASSDAIGIGTNHPSATLDVVGYTELNGDLQVWNFNDSGGKYWNS